MILKSSNPKPPRMTQTPRHRLRSFLCSSNGEKHLLDTPASEQPGSLFRIEDWSQHSQTAREESSLNAPSIYHHEILHDYISVVCLVEEIQRLSCKCSPAQISQPPSISILPSVHVGKLIERNLIPNSLILSYPFILSPRLEVQGLANNETKSLLMIVVFDFPNLAGCAENRENQHASFVFSILFQAVQNSSKVWLTSVHVFLKFSMPTRLNWCFWDLSRARYEYWNNTEKNPNQVSKFCRSCISNGGPARVMTEPPSENSEFLLLPTAGGHWCKACSVLGAAVGGQWTLLFCCVSWAISTHPCNWKLDFSYLSYINICDHC